MNPQKKIKSLIVIAVFLLLSNIAMLIFFLILGNSKPHAMHHNIVADFLKNDMRFSSEQMVKYDSLKNHHLKNIKPYFENVKSAKDNFYHLLYETTPQDSVMDYKAFLIGKNQQDLDKQIFIHFSNIRNLCTPDQLPKFDSSFKNIVTKLTGRMKKEDDNKNNGRH